MKHVLVAGVGLEVERLIALPKVVEVDHLRGAGNRCHSMHFEIYLKFVFNLRFKKQHYGMKIIFPLRLRFSDEGGGPAFP